MGGAMPLWLIRHGESHSNTGVWSNNPGEVSITKKGEKQACDFAAKITDRPDLIIVSPFKRAKDSAKFIMERWNEVAMETWPIQEFTYLSSMRTEQERKKAIEEYWQRSDVHYRDGESAESFDDFMKRVRAFDLHVSAQKGFIVVVGHGQFIKAFMLNRSQPYDGTSQWMKMYRENETSNPVRNGEIIRLHC
jgi:broad specificity phosphatase PhoE